MVGHAHSGAQWRTIVRLPLLRENKTPGCRIQRVLENDFAVVTDAPSDFRRYETGRVGPFSTEFRKAWDSRAVRRSTRNRPKMMQEFSRACVRS